MTKWTHGKKVLLLDIAAQFRRDLVDQGFGWFIQPRRYFSLQLNYGEIWIQPNAEVVLKVINLAQNITTHPEYSEYTEILDLVAFKLELNEDTVHWINPNMVPEGQLQNWISLRQWLLTQNGH